MADKFIPEEFTACMTFDRIVTNHTGSGYNWHETASGKQRYINQRVMGKILSTCTLNKGVMKGKFITAKRGQVLSSEFLEELPLDCEECESKIQCALKMKEKIY